MKRTKLFMIICIIGIFLFVIGHFTYAWVGDNGMTSPIGLTASLHKSYFESGDGGSEYTLDGSGNIVQSETGPFEIKYPIQFYYLAWLQALGYFESDENEDGTIDQYYFYVSDDLDMSEFVLPPVGTKDNPFLGHFDGQGHMIYNVNIVSDKASTTDSPETEFSQTEIVGLFGVIGTLGDTANSYTTKSGTTYTYDSSINEVKDLYISNVNVNTKSSDTLIGIAAGYVNGKISNVGVINSSITFSSSHSALDYTSNLSDYALIGYCTDEFKDNVHAERVELGKIATDEYEVTEEDPGDAWGGSINMEEMYTRLYNIAKNNSTRNNNYVYDKKVTFDTDGTTILNSENTTGTLYTYSSQRVGSFVFTINPDDQNRPYSNFMYLHGGTTITPTTKTIAGTVTGYTISSGAHYLSTDGSTLFDSNADEATVWQISGNNIYTTVNGRRYYLHYTSSGWITTTYTLDISTSSSTWTITNNGNNSQIYYRRNYNSYYVKYSNNSWRMATGSTNISLAQKTGNIYNYVDGTRYVDYTGTNNTYFPLLVENNSNNVAEKNTGYVISGSNDRTTSDEYPNKSGDIRVSKYATSRINASYSDGSFSTIYTINASGSTVEINNESAYEKLADSKTTLASTIQSANSIYGLHFMAGEISMDNIVTANYALINGDEYTNYQFPANSIDFTIPKKGKINFFAGTYFSGNNSFFSLHKIERDSNHNIIAIKEIKEIYGTNDPSDPYIYKYGDNTWSATKTSDYSLLFATSRIKRQSSLTADAVYYFEIPANEGEYALGSVSGGTGAYLMYLDLSANKQIVMRTEVRETWQEIKVDDEIPNGVAIVESKGDIINETKSATIKMPTGTSGTTTISRTGNAVTYTDSTGAEAAFIGDGITANGETDGGGKTTILTERLTYYDYNTTTKVEKVIVTTTIITTNPDGTTSRTSTQTIDGTTNNEYVDDNHTVTLGNTVAKWSYYDRSDATVSTEFGFDYKASPSTYTITITTDKEIKVKHQLVDSSYSVSINGTALTTTEAEKTITAN